MPAPISRTLAEFAAKLKYEDIPDLAVEAINTGLAMDSMRNGMGTDTAR